MTTTDTPVTTVIGIDPALTATGIAAWRDGRLATHTVYTDPKRAVEERMRFIVANVVAAVTRRTFIVMEAPYVTANGDTSMKLAGLHYVLRYALVGRGVPFGVLRPGQLKQFATGNGGASKEEMVSMARAAYGPGAGLGMGSWNPAETSTERLSHEADALWCLAAGLHHGYTHNALPREIGPRHLNMEPGISIDQLHTLQGIAADWPALEWEGTHA